jgi:hypothetical protein
MTLTFKNFAKNKNFLDKDLEIPEQEILLNIGNKLYDAFQIYLKQYKSSRYREIFPVEAYYPAKKFEKNKIKYFSSIINNSPEVKMWLAMQYFYFTYFINRDGDIKFFDDGINFFNWITGEKKEFNEQLQQSFESLIERKMSEEPVAEGGKFQKKFYKYSAKIKMLAVE